MIFAYSYRIFNEHTNAANLYNIINKIREVDRLRYLTWPPFILESGEKCQKVRRPLSQGEKIEPLQLYKQFWFRHGWKWYLCYWIRCGCLHFWFWHRLWLNFEFWSEMIPRLEVMMTVKELANYHYLVWNLQNTLQYKSLKKYVNGTFAWMRYINSAYSDGAFISFRVGPMYMVHMYYVFSLFLILTEWPKIL